VLSADNPYARPSTLPFGLPPFDRIRFAHHLPAIEAGMAQEREEVEAIATGPWPPSYADTIEALERSGQLLERVQNVFHSELGSNSTRELRALEATVAPRLAAHEDAIGLDERVFRRIADLHERRAELHLDAEQLRVLERYHLMFVRAGATLDEASQDRLRAVNEQLSSLMAAFGTALLEDATALAVVVEDAAQLDGLTPEAIASAAQAARDRGLASGHVLAIELPSGQSVLEHLHDRELRERIHRAAVSRGRRGGAYDTRELVVSITALRAERAGLLGYATHAEYQIADQTAGEVTRVVDMMTALAPAAVAKAHIEQRELEALLHADGHEGPLQAWDWAYYAERVRHDRFAVDGDRLRAYFELDRVLGDGAMRVASELHGLTFSERDDLPLPHPDARTWEVRREDGEPIGLLICDLFARESKRGGAWEMTLCMQSHLLESPPVVSITLSIPKPPGGAPALLTPDEVRTIFHEFGHALHDLLSDVRHPLVAGTSMPNDFLEFPSQLNEIWAWEPESLARYARHHESGEPLPQADADALRAAATYGSGHATTEALAAMLLDQAWHALQPGDRVDDVEAFEAAALERHGLALDAVPSRYGSTYFNHVFADSYYSAAYYSYLWAEVLDADAADWFREHGGLQRSLGDAYEREILARGFTVDPMTAYRALTGRDPDIARLIKRRELDVDAVGV
jgi:peptidyl-dipeptidase Dcp